jgi:hypothetical protein
MEYPAVAFNPLSRRSKYASRRHIIYPMSRCAGQLGRRPVRVERQIVYLLRDLSGPRLTCFVETPSARRTNGYATEARFTSDCEVDHRCGSFTKGNTSFDP